MHHSNQSTLFCIIPNSVNWLFQWCILYSVVLFCTVWFHSYGWSAWTLQYWCASISFRFFNACITRIKLMNSDQFPMRAEWTAVIMLKMNNCNSLISYKDKEQINILLFIGQLVHASQYNWHNLEYIILILKSWDFCHLFYMYNTYNFIRARI